MSCLHVLEINSLFLNSVPNIFFPHSKDFFFSLVYSFPCSAKVFEVGDSFVEFCLIFQYSKSRSKGFAVVSVKACFLYSFLKRFRVIVPPLSPLVDLELLFLCEDRECHNFIHCYLICCYLVTRSSVPTLNNLTW